MVRKEETLGFTKERRLGNKPKIDATSTTTRSVILRIPKVVIAFQ